MAASEQIRPQHVKIDWSAAEIDGGLLTVPLAGQPPKGWGKRFTGVLGLLDQKPGGWGKIAVRKHAIEAHDVQEGAEADLRHLLESALMQANADLYEDPGEGRQEEHDPAATADRRMAEVFRGFAEAPAESE